MKNIKKFFTAMHFIAIIAFMAVIGFAMAACDNGNGKEKDDPIPFEPQYLGASFRTDDGARIAASINITSNEGRDPRSLADGWYEYTVELGGVILSQGVVQVVNGVYTFYEGATISFGYNSNTNETTGKISLSQAARNALEQLGATLGAEYDMEQITELEAGNYWDGVTLPGVKIEDGWPVRAGNSSISFDGLNYRFVNENDEVETGTCFYTTRESGGDVLFLFFREGKDPEIAVYLWEGLKGEWREEEYEDGTTDNVYFPGHLEFHNWVFDPMGISRTNEDKEMRYFSDDYVDEIPTP